MLGGGDATVQSEHMFRVPTAQSQETRTRRSPFPELNVKSYIIATKVFNKETLLWNFKKISLLVL